MTTIRQHLRIEHGLRLVRGQDPTRLHRADHLVIARVGPRYDTVEHEHPWMSTYKLQPLEAAALHAVELWSLRIHGFDSDLHAWSMIAGTNTITGGAVPPWPGGRKSTGATRLDTIRRIVDGVLQGGVL